MLLATKWLDEKPVDWRATRVTTLAFAAIVAANLLSVIAEAGLNWDLPPDPVRYLLFG
jgi:hypothetical protein